MRHTFKLIDNLYILLNDVPRSIETEEGKNKAKEILAGIRAYTASLRKMIESHRTREYLDRLHALHIDEIEGWADQVAELFGKFDQLLINVEEDAEVLEKVIKNKPEDWLPTIRTMALGMVATGLHYEEEEMRRFRRIAIFEEHELRSILDAQKHIAELLE